MKRNKYNIIFPLIIMGVVFLIIYCYVNNKELKLKSNKSITIGVINDMDIVLRGDGLWVKYEFETRSDTIKNKKRILIESAYLNILKSKLVGKEFSVIYDTTDIHNNKILIFKSDYLDNGLQPPDSLRQIFGMLDSLRFDKK